MHYVRLNVVAVGVSDRDDTGKGGHNFEFWILNVEWGILGVLVGLVEMVGLVILRSVGNAN